MLKVVQFLLWCNALQMCAVIVFVCQIGLLGQSCFYSAAALCAMQSAVLANSVRLSIRLSHAGIVPRQMKIGSCGLHCEIA